ncbi:MAG: hypothetical protein JW871_06585 [Endomicrobiales bacterium]|nr:hypothetical protein [Endomicrobiales bacterium]
MKINQKFFKKVPAISCFAIMCLSIAMTPYQSYAAIESEITIYAAGIPVDGVYPTMELVVENKKVATFPNVQGNIYNRTFEEFTYLHPHKPALEDIQVWFTNGLEHTEVPLPEARILFVDRIVVDGVTYESESPNTYSVGLPNQGYGPPPRYAQTEALVGSGYFQYARSQHTSQQQDFGLGWYGHIRQDAWLSELTYWDNNLMLPYISWGFPYDTGYQYLLGYLNEAAAQNMKVWVELKRDWIKYGQLDDLADFIYTVKGHPAVYGWYLYDEPNYDPELSPPGQADLAVQKLKAAYDLIKSIDGNHPVSLAIYNVIPQIYLDTPAADIFFCAFYPVFANHPEFDGMFMVTDTVQRESVRIENIGKQLQPVIQAHGELPNGEPEWDFRDPTDDEMRFMFYTSSIRDVTGIQLFSDFHANSRPFRTGNFLINELASISDGLIDGIFNDPTIECETSYMHEGNPIVGPGSCLDPVWPQDQYRTNLNFRHSADDKNHYIIAVNEPLIFHNNPQDPYQITWVIDPHDLTAKFYIPDWIKADLIEVVNEDRYPIAMQPKETGGDRFFTDTCDPYKVHIYKLYSSIEYTRINSTHLWGNVSFNNSYAVPIVIAGIETYNGGDPAGVRIKDLDADGMQMKIEEEQSKDTETNHTTETVSYIKFQYGNIKDSDNEVIGEAGTVSRSQASAGSWYTIEMSRNYSNPVVFMQVASCNDASPCHIRLKSITSSSFKYQIEEWDYLDGAHSSETMTYVVLEAGNHELLNGMNLEVGKINANHNWASVSYNQSFSVSPVTISQCQTYNGGQAVVTRQRNISSYGFQIKLQEEEGNDGSHATESIGYIAIE